MKQNVLKTKRRMGTAETNTHRLRFPLGNRTRPVSELNPVAGFRPARTRRRRQARFAESASNDRTDRTTSWWCSRMVRLIGRVSPIPDRAEGRRLEERSSTAGVFGVEKTPHATHQ